MLGATTKWIQALLLSPFVRQHLRPLSTTPNKKDLLLVKELIEAGKITPVIDRTFALSKVPDAFPSRTFRGVTSPGPAGSLIGRTSGF